MDCSAKEHPVEEEEEGEEEVEETVIPPSSASDDDQLRFIQPIDSSSPAMIYFPYPHFSGTTGEPFFFLFAFVLQSVLLLLFLSRVATRQFLFGQQQTKMSALSFCAELFLSRNEFLFSRLSAKRGRIEMRYHISSKRFKCVTKTVQHAGFVETHQPLLANLHWGEPKDKTSYPFFLPFQKINHWPGLLSIYSSCPFNPLRFFVLAGSWAMCRKDRLAYLMSKLRKQFPMVCGSFPRQKTQN